MIDNLRDNKHTQVDKISKGTFKEKISKCIIMDRKIKISLQINNFSQTNSNNKIKCFLKDQKNKK